MGWCSCKRGASWLDTAKKLCGNAVMEQRGLVILWWAVCVAVVAIVWVDAFGASLEPVWSWMATNDKAAFWIQAFGSIAAIIGSTGVAIWVSRRDAERRRIEAREAAQAEEVASLGVLRTAIMVLRVALNVCQTNTAGRSWNSNTARLAEQNLQGAIKLLSEVDGRRLPYWFETQRGVMLVSAMSAASGAMSESAWKLIPPDFGVYKTSLAHLDEVEREVVKRLTGF